MTEASEEGDFPHHFNAKKRTSFPIGHTLVPLDHVAPVEPHEPLTLTHLQEVQGEQEAQEGQGDQMGRGAPYILPIAAAKIITRRF
jgi:hypothetical protein